MGTAITPSLSARRACIEIYCLNSANNKVPIVALRKESVDRNKKNGLQGNRHNTVALRKESVDRNMWWGVRKAVGSLVALRKESVDRNCPGRIWSTALACRSPQGERG